jgi:cyclophilin family peptidyl-prolyl cis-trans isomerase/protein-disulfide isomerase
MMQAQPASVQIMDRERDEYRRSFPRKMINSHCSLLICVLCLTFFIPACAPTGTTQPTYPSTPTLTPVQLGPTSTPSPAPLTAIPPIPSPTLIPIPPISDDDWSRGSLNARVTFLVYADFQCPYCALLAPVLAQLEQWHSEDIRTVFRHFPLISLHDKASLAGQAAEAAGAQGSFWAMHDLLFERYNDWTGLSPEQFKEWLITAAEELSIDVHRFEDDIVSGHYAQDMEEAFNIGLASGIPGTPLLFINGILYQVKPSLNNLEAYVRLELLTSMQYDNYPPMTIEENEDVQYLARIELELGEIVIQLYPEYAPLAVNSFIFLAGEGWFDGNIFHRVVSDSFVESGDPTGTGFGEPGYHFADEITEALSFDEPGMVALSSSGPDTNGSQFFITLAPLPELNNSRTIFGRLIKGLDLLKNLQARQPLEDLLIPPEAVIVSITIEVR